MKVMHKVFIIICICFSQSVLASEQVEIQKVMSMFWNAYKNKDFQEAARFIYPEDLESTKNEVLPLFLQAANHQDPEAKDMGEKFFYGIPFNRREKMTAVEVYCAIQNFALSVISQDDFKKVTGGTSTITETFFSNPDTALVNYSVLISGETATYQDRLGKVNGVWYIRLKDVSQNSSAKKLKELLAK